MKNTIRPASINNQTLAELHYKKACKFATAAEDLTSGYTEDHSALTITKDANGVVTIDGGTLALDDHILVKDQTDTKENGIYKVTQLGSGSTPLILTREDHFNSSTECASGKVYFVIISSGSVNANKSAFIGVGTEAVETTFGTTTFTVSESGIASLITVADESSDAECFPVFTTAATGNLAPKSGTNLTFNSNSGELTATSFSGALTGDVTGNASGSSGSCTGNAATATLASTVTVTDSDVSTNFPIVFHNESNGLLDDTGSFLYNPNVHDLIIKGGNLKIQNSGGATNLSISTAGNIITDNKLGTAADQEYITFETSNEVNTFINNTERLSVTTAGIIITGTISATGDITALTSDKRLKENIEIIESPLDKINQLSGFTYHWSKEKCEKAGFEPSDEKQVGVFAQDIQAVLPEAVKSAPFDRDKNGESKSGENYLTVQYEKIVPLLIESIKEQQKQIEELRNEVEFLKNK